MRSDPWSELPAPPNATALSARRVDDETRASFFWAKDAKSHCILLLQHDCPFPSDVKIPRLRGVQILQVPLGTERGQLLFRLEDGEQRDIFEQLCRDIISASHAVESDEAAIRVSLSRTWRWYHLLRAGSGGLLSEEKQKGLIGELLTLEALLSRLGHSIPIECWRGPLAEPKDFMLPGNIAVESKAIRGVDAPFVQISSEWQLDRSATERLFLVVAQVTRSAESEPESVTLTDIVSRVRTEILDESPAELGAFDSRLLAAGYSPNDNYADYWWTLDELLPFEVTPEFPRIEGTDIPDGVERVTYNVTLARCTAFRLDLSDFLDQLQIDEA